jgi:hypothetical protein
MVTIMRQLIRRRQVVTRREKPGLAAMTVPVVAPVDLNEQRSSRRATDRTSGWSGHGDSNGGGKREL